MKVWQYISGRAWLLMLVICVLAIVLGCVVGLIIGKYQVMKARSRRGPILSVKERVLSIACIMAGAGFILFGAFHDFSADNAVAVDSHSVQTMPGKEAVMPGVDGGETPEGEEQPETDEATGDEGDDTGTDESVDTDDNDNDNDDAKAEVTAKPQARPQAAAGVRAATNETATYVRIG